MIDCTTHARSRNFSFTIFLVAAAFAFCPSSSVAQTSCEQLWEIRKERSEPRPENVERLQFRTERLELTPLTEEMAFAAFEVLRDPAAAKMTQFKLSTPIELRKYIAGLKTNLKQLRSGETTFDLAIVFEGQIIGTIKADHFFMPEHAGQVTSTYVIGYQIDAKFQNRGFAKEAISRVLKFLFQEGKANEIQANVFPENLASVAVLEKAGFQFRMKNAKFRNFALTVKEWRRSNVFRAVQPR